MVKITATLLACSAAVLLALPAEARKGTRASKSGTEITRAQKPADDSATCIRAESEDPAGNYAAYPCWARAAFGPRRVGGR
jgi:hypothetical protein